MNAYTNWLELSKTQTQAANEAAQAMSACVGAMMEASAAFAKTSAERNMEFAATLMGARTIESATEIHAAFVRDSIRASSAMAGKIADACSQAAKQCGAVAAKTMGSLKTSPDR